MTGSVLVAGELAAAAVAYAAGARRVRRWPRARTAAFMAALVAAGVALIVLDGAAHRRLSAHMVQHLLLAFVAAPLLVVGSPLHLALRATGARARRALAVPALADPVLGWLALPVTMTVTHLTGIYQAALEHPAVHAGEHIAYVAAAVLFWRPVLGADPVPHRPGPIGRLLYLVLAAGPLAVVGVAMSASRRPWYDAYGGRPDALADQHAAGAIMWVGGGVVLAAILVVTTWAAVEREHRRRVAYEEALR